MDNKQNPGNKSLYNKFVNSTYLRVSGYVVSILGIILGLLLTLLQAVMEGFPTLFLVLAVVCIVMGIFMLILLSFRRKYEKKEDAEFSKKQDVINSINGNTAILRAADMKVKQKTLLETVVAGYSICYRRVKTTNELVINGNVYDEKKGILELAHTLIAVVDGHRIEAGFDNTHSFIKFDEKGIDQKLRLI